MVPAVEQVRLARFYLDAAAPWQALALLDALPHDDRPDTVVRLLRARALQDLGRPTPDADPQVRPGDVLAAAYR
ncbi:MAG: hypothetical protein AVDCRST_MAG66-3863 [uncultured Pseudonocardia sp.]|uniref:Uncharacterized protein n=1 Tax=uncultured Pseudonocardia sp. TaxID=211455 RepID=A0A6J4QAC9_9PSEU|nr:MAG: hypothetical protein AVDCRST_MAG66-3863 [uncultured Pseudonocardia sp.]